MKNLFKKTVFVKYFTPVISSTQIACDVIWVPHVIFTWATKKTDFFYKEFFLQPVTLIRENKSDVPNLNQIGT